MNYIASAVCWGVTRAADGDFAAIDDLRALHLERQESPTGLSQKIQGILSSCAFIWIGLMALRCSTNAAFAETSPTNAWARADPEVLRLRPNR